METIIIIIIDDMNYLSRLILNIFVLLFDIYILFIAKNQIFILILKK